MTDHDTGVDTDTDTDRESDGEPDGEPDGRVRRGERTRAAIVHALLDLLNHGVVAPTSQQIAATAGVSVRSVFQHFEDMEALYGALARAQAERTRELFGALSDAGGRDERIDRLAERRSTLFEHIAPVRHALGDRARSSAAIAHRLDEVGTLLRDQIERQFAEELSARRGPQRRQLLDVLDLLWSFDAWDRLRNTQGLDAEAASATLRAATRELLA